MAAKKKAKRAPKQVFLIIHNGKPTRGVAVRRKDLDPGIDEEIAGPYVLVERVRQR